MEENVDIKQTLASLEKKQQKQKNIKKAIKLISLVAFLFSLILATWVFWIEPDQLTIKKTEIQLSKWHKEHNGLKVALLTDLHVGSPHITLEKLEFLVAETNKETPDLVVILGDLVITGIKGGTFIEPEPIAQRLKNLQAPLGIVAVLGNHDWWYNGERVRQALEKEGVRVLENDAIKLTRNDKSFWVGGLAEPWTRKPDIKATLEKIDENPILMLTHNPDIFPQIPETVSLTLAGHTHGGQVKLPLFGRPIVPSAFGERYAVGHVIENGRHLFVGSGVGTSILPVRFCVPPEVVILRINQG
ncbi:MAG: metallophosphoesterase [Acidobacteria bacterium]|nr:metallophosphoesterase [Acidobacteriota bacterium]